MKLIGHILIENGIKVDEEKMKSIVQISEPRKKKELTNSSVWLKVKKTFAY